MGVKIWLGVIVSLILVVACVWFFWGEDEVVDAENSNVKVDETLGDLSVENSSVENLSVVEGVGEGISWVTSLSLVSEVEHVELVRSERLLNLGETVSEVFGRYVDEKIFPIFLKSNSGQDLTYKYEMRFSEDLVLEEFEDSDYKDGNETIGFNFQSGDLILNYTINFDNILWADFVGEKIRIFGRSYKVVSSNYEAGEIVLFEFPYSFTLMEDDVVIIDSSFYNGTNFSISFIDENKVILMVGGEKINSLNEGGFYYDEDFSIFVEEILYSRREGESRVNVVISPKNIVLRDGYLGHDSHSVEEVGVFIKDDEYLDGIKLSWRLEEDAFFTPAENYSNFTLHFFESLTFSMDDYDRDENKKKYWDVYLDAVSYDVLSDTQDARFLG